MFLAAWALGSGPYTDLDRKLSHVSRAEVEQTVSDSGIDRKDPNLTAILENGSRDDNQRAIAVRDYVSMRSLFEGNRSAPTSAPPDISKIKSSPLYRKSSDATESNWLSRALERIRLNLNPLRPRVPNVPSVNAGAANFLVYIMWGLLALLVAVFLFLAIRQFIWKLERSKKLRATALIEDDEPERTLDEWLALSDQLQAEGRFREAIRCLYVACLLRFDEHRIGRFDRTQTNWEHYRRIQSSPNYPKEFDLLTPTRDFDHVWYGFRPTNSAEVQRFRDAYKTLTSLLTQRAAAR